MLLHRFLDQTIRDGRLRVIDADGGTHDLGRGDGEPIVLRLHDRRLHRRLVLRPSLALGEGYMDGTLTVENGSVYDLIALCAQNVCGARGHPLQRLLEGFEFALRRVMQHNPIGRARANVAHHYDLSGRLYDLFLDADRQYSCAYYETGHEDLETAQEKKKRHLAAKLHLKRGQRVLDIGSGWGGMGLYLAQAEDISVTGVTLSMEQHALSEKRAREAGLDDRVRFRLEDYRAVEERFDRIISVGMFEHVGVSHYPEFFERTARMLADDGVMVLHTIGRSDGPGYTDPWIRKYIFPGGYIPALSEITPHIERAGLYVTDVEVLRLHYAETLKEWRRRFVANWDQAKALYDERFCRMWEFYLAASEAAFRFMGMVVFQIQMAKSQDALPLTRDYIPEWERKAERRSGSRRPSRVRVA